MRKKITFIILAVLLISIFTLSSCTKTIVVAKIDDQEVYKNQYDVFWENVKSQNDITDEILSNPDYLEDINYLKEQVLNYVVSQEIIKIELAELGYYNISQQEHESAKSQRDAIIENGLLAREDEILAELGDDYSEKDRVKMENKYTQQIYDEIGMDEDELLQYFIDAMVFEKAKAELVNVTVTEEDIIAAFNEAVEADKDYFTDNLSAYEYYVYQAGYTPFYTPEGLRYIRHVLIKFDSEIVSEISGLRDEGKDDEADAVREEALLTILSEANEVLDFLTNGDITMDEAILEYNDDPGMIASPEGYMVSDGSTSYMDGFAEAAMLLENVGDISGLVVTDYGYHILEYSADVESGPIDMELVRDDIYDGVLETKEEEEWDNMIDAWTAKHEVVYYYDRLAEENGLSQDTDELDVIE